MSKEGKERKPRYYTEAMGIDTEELTQGQIQILKSFLKESLTPETTNGTWCPACIVYKQSYPVSSLIKSLLGGDILQCPTQKGDIHYWNLLPMGEEIDLTEEGIKYSRDSLRYEEVDVLQEDHLMFNSTREAERYSLLESKANSVINGYGVETLGELLEVYKY